MIQEKKPQSPMQRVKQRRRIRAVIQLIFFILAPSVYTAAFGGIKEIAGNIGASDPIAMSSFVTALIAVCIYTILFGRFFCGYACAFGSLGDAVYAAGQAIQKKLKKKLPKLPDRAVLVLQKVKYLILAIIVVLCAAGVYGSLSGWSPWDVFSMLTSLRIPEAKYWLGGVLLVLIVIGMAVQERFFCQFLCPMGAVFALLPHIGTYRRDRTNCLPRCSACEKNCPVHVETDASNPHCGECICCGKCSDICPKRNISYIKYGTDGNTWIPVIVRSVILFALFFALSMIRFL